MKKMMVYLVLAMGLSVNFVSGQTPSTNEVQEIVLPMISSKAALKAWALRQVTQGEIQASSKYEVEYFYERTQITNASPSEILQGVTSKLIRVKTTKPEEDEIRVYLALENSDYQACFYGWSEPMPLKQREDGTWTFDQPKIVLRMASYIPVPSPFDESELSHLYVQIRNENGYVIRYESLSSWNGKIYFPVEFAGQTGEVIFRLNSGEEVAVDLSTGEVLDSISATGTIEARIDNYEEIVLDQHMEFTLPFTCGENGEIPSAPVIRVKALQGKLLTISAPYYYEREGQTIIEYPRRATAYSESGGFEVELPVSTNGSIHAVFDEDGVYQIILEYPSIEDEPVSYGGGKG